MDKILEKKTVYNKETGEMELRIDKFENDR